MTDKPTPSFRLPFRAGLTAIAGLFAGALAFSAPAHAQSYGAQGYGGQQYSYGGDTRLVYCESDEFRQKSCRLDGPVSRVYLQDRRSDSRCIEGRDWGYDRGAIWVRNGCRAVFAVSYGRSGGYGRPGYGGYDRDYDRRYDRRDARPGRGYGRDYDRRDARGHPQLSRVAVEQCQRAVEYRLRRDGRYRADFQRVNFVRPDRDGRGFDVSLSYGIGRGYGAGSRDILCSVEGGQARITRFL